MQEPTIEEIDELPPRRGGLWLPLDILIAPARAFRTIEASRQWLAAYVLLVCLGLIELYLLAPSLAHVLAVQSHAAGGSGTISPAELRSDFTLEIAFRVIGPLAAWGFVATLLAMATFGSRDRPKNVAVYFSLGMNCAIPSWIGGVITAIVVRLRDPKSFRSVSDLVLAVPLNLAWFRQHGQPREIAFLGYWDVFTLWTFVLLGLGFGVIAGVRPVPALLFALGIGLSFALVQAAGV